MRKLAQQFAGKWIKDAIALGLLIVVVMACSKQNDPTPTSSGNNNNNNNNNTNNNPNTDPSANNKMCDDSICKVPFRILSVFVPEGFYDTGDQSTTLKIDSIGEPVAYAGEAMRITYTKGAGWGWGAHFLNNSNWGATYKITPSATKVTLYVKSDYSANVTFNAFANENYGKVELYKKANPVTPVWEKITIPLKGKPATFNAPLNIVIDGVDTQGKVTVVDIKDVLFE